MRKPITTGGSSLKKNPRAQRELVTFAGDEFYTETEHAASFVKHVTAPRYQHPRAVYVPSEAKLDGLSSFQSDYQNWPTVIPERHQAPKYAPSSSVFVGNTTSKMDYGEKELPPPRIRSNHYVNSAEHMGFDVGKGFGNPLDAAVASVNGVYTPSTVKMDGLSSNRSDYQAWPTSIPQRRQPLKYIPSDGAFDGTSTSMQDYSAKEIPKFYVRDRPKWEKSPDKISSETTSNTSFLQWEVKEAPSSRIKTAVAPRRGHASVLNIGHHHD